MKKQRITYGIHGMMEMEVVVKVGSARMKVLFTGGSMTAMGVNPARFTTDNLLTQKAIENSAQYKKGLIKKINVINLPEEVKILKNSEGREQAAAPQTKTEGWEERAEAPLPETNTEEMDDEGQIPATPEAAPQTKTEEMDDKGQETEDEAEKGIIQVEFSLNDDAKDYLEQNFGANKAKLRNRDEIKAYGLEHGVDIVFV